MNFVLVLLSLMMKMMMIMIIGDGIPYFQTCQPYWPDEDEPKQRYGPLEVELMNINAENKSKSIITRDFRVILASEKVKLRTNFCLNIDV